MATFYPDERICVFIDGSNLYASSRSLNHDIDYRKLSKYFKDKGRLVRILYYTALHENNDDYSPIKPLVDWLDYNGYTIVSKPTKEFTDSMGHRKIKGNMDIELAVDMIELADKVDHIVLMSGDGDFRKVIEFIQRRGVRVTVISTLMSQPPMVADELRRQADQFIELRDIMDEIGRSTNEYYSSRKPYVGTITTYTDESGDNGDIEVEPDPYKSINISVEDDTGFEESETADVGIELLETSDGTTHAVVQTIPTTVAVSSTIINTDTYLDVSTDAVELIAEEMQDLPQQVIDELSKSAKTKAARGKLSLGKKSVVLKSNHSNTSKWPPFEDAIVLSYSKTTDKASVTFDGTKASIPRNELYRFDNNLNTFITITATELTQLLKT